MLGTQSGKLKCECLILGMILRLPTILRKTRMIAGLNAMAYSHSLKDLLANIEMTLEQRSRSRVDAQLEATWTLQSSTTYQRTYSSLTTEYRSATSPNHSPGTHLRLSARHKNL